MSRSMRIENRPRGRLDPACRGRRLVLSIAALAVAATAAADAPARIAARMPSEIRVGEPARLEVLLLDERARLVPAPREMRVVLRGAEALMAGDEVLFPAGEEAIAVELEAPKTGAWAIEVIVEGFESVWVPCASVAAETEGEPGERSWLLASPGEPPRAVPEHQPWARPATPVGALAAPPRAILVRPVGRSVESGRAQLRRMAGSLRGDVEETRAALERALDVELEQPRELGPALLEAGPLAATEAGEPEPSRGPGEADGELRLIPGEAALGPGSDGGYRLQVFGFWYRRGQPATRTEPLELALVADPALSDLTLEPSPARLGAGEMRTAVQLVGRRQGRIELRALYPGGESTPARVHFLPPRPERLELAGLPARLRTIGVAGLEVTVRLLDGSGRPTIAAEEVAATVTAVSESGSGSWPLAVPAGSGEGRTRIELERFGEHRLAAWAPGLDEAAAVVRLRFDVPVLLWALAGGLVGASVRLVRRGRRRLRRVGRALLLAMVAAGVLVLRRSFGLLDWLTGGDPGSPWSGLAELPVANQAASFLAGFLVGLAGDWFWDRLVAALTRRPEPAEGG